MRLKTAPATLCGYVRWRKYAYYAAEFDDLWHDLKAYAATYAASNRPLPLHDECAEYLTRTLAHRALSLPPDAFEFYCSELRAMISDYRRDFQAAEKTHA